MGIFYKKAIEFVDRQIGFVEKCILAEYSASICPLCHTPPNIENPKWKGNPIEFVELVYALYETGSFGKTPLKTLFGSLGKMLGCEITNYYRLFWDIKGRTA